MSEFIERGIKFTFPDDWNTLVYEKSEYYTDKILTIQHTKAVDFLCCHQEKLILIEAKFFSEKPLESIEHLIDEVSCQFKDTICGIAMGHICNAREMKIYTEALLPNVPKEHHKLILFLEIQNEHPNFPKVKMHQLALQHLRNRFSPLGFAVRVLDSSKLSNSPWKAEIQ